MAMMNRWVFSLVVVAASAAWACGYWRDENVYLPRAPLPAYEGHVLHGVVLPDFAPRHLALLYRSASGVPVSELELSSLLRAWNVVYQQTTSTSDAVDARTVWLQKSDEVLRGKTDAGGLEPPELQTADFVSYLNVHAGAYRRAVERLEVRKKRYAAAPALLSEWVRRQNRALGLQVADGPGLGSVPPAMNKAWQEDVAYFAAATAFYQGNFEAAAAGFDALQGDEAKWGTYSAARAHLRWATLTARSPEERAQHFAEAERRLRAIKSSDEVVSSAATALLLRVLRERKDWCELLPKVMAKRQGDALPHLLVAFEDTLEDKGCPQLPDLRDWLTTFRGLEVTGWKFAAPALEGARQAARHALERWRATKSRPWLLAALTGADGTEPELDALLTAAHAIAPGDIVGVTVALHEVRLLRLSGRLAEARARRAELPIEKWSIGVRNHFELEAFFAAQTAEEAAQHLDLKQAGTLVGEITELESQQASASLSAMALGSSLDSVSLGVLSAQATLPLELRKSLGWASLVRAGVLEGDVAAAARRVLELDPKATGLAAIVDAKDPVTARGLTLNVAMDLPWSYRFRTWVPGRVDPLPTAAPFEVPWVTPRARAEFTAVGAGAGHVFARAALAFAQQQPRHALSPELLAHAVALSHTVSGEGDTKAAFQHLHKVYGNTTWAQNTPIYW